MKKIISVFLAFLHIVLLCTVANASEDIISNSSKSLMEQLNDEFGVFEGTDFTPEREISRAEFASLLVRALRMNSTEYKQIFIDVTEESAYGADITTAHKMGIISGNGKGVFNPKASVTYSAAIRMAVGALGYNDIAKNTGGFPTGYFQIASSIGLTSGIASDENSFDFSDAVKLIDNFLQADMCTLNAITGNGATEGREEGVNILNKYYFLTKEEGIMEQAGYVSLIYGAYIDSASVIIEGNSFGTDREDISEYLGYKVAGWYDESDKMNIILADNKIIKTVIDAKDIDRYADGTLYTYNEKNEATKRYTLSDTFVFVRNGRAIAHTNEDFIFDVGSVSLIDNNRDGKYDVVYAKRGEYMSAGYKNQNTSTVYDKNLDGDGVTLDTKHGYMCKIYSVENDGSLKQIDFDTLPLNSILYVLRSDDGKYAEVIASRESIKGVISEVSENEIVIDGKTYKLNNYFKNNFNVDAGKNYTLLMAYDGTVSAISSGSKKALKYGFVYKYGRKTEGVAPKAELVMFTEDSTHTHALFADDFLLNGEMKKLSVSGSEIDALLTDGNKLIPQVIRYKLSDEGKITVLDTYETVAESAKNEVRYDVSPESEDDLTLNIENLNSCWYPSGFASHLFISGSSVMFRVPEDIKTRDTSDIDEELFKICSGTDFYNYQRVKVDAYDVDPSLVPGAVVVYQTAGNATISQESAEMIVEDIKTAIDDEGEKGYNLYLWTGGTYTTLFISSDRYQKLSAEGNVPKSGDIVRVAYDYRGYVLALSVDARYNAVTGKVDITENAPKGGQIDEGCYWGYAYAKGAQNFSLDITNGGKSGYNAGYGDPILNNITTFNADPATKVGIYDSEKKMVLQGTMNDLQDELTVGKENASYAFVVCRTHIVKGIFIYR